MCVCVCVLRGFSGRGCLDKGLGLDKLLIVFNSYFMVAGGRQLAEGELIDYQVCVCVCVCVCNC